MSKAIIIGTYGGREVWEKDCRESLAGYTDYPVISINVPWELNVISWVYEWTNLDEFLFLQDTVVVKSQDWLEELFDHEGSVSLCTKPFYMYLGKYTRTDLARALPFPEVKNKRQAVDHEGEWTSWYNEGSTNTKYLWDIPDPQIFVEHNGRLNMFYENDHIVKYKGTWSPEMVPDA